MTTPPTLLDLFSQKPLSQDAHLKASHLVHVFQSKIAKSQATGKDGVRIRDFSGILQAEAELIEKRAFAKTYRFTRFKERLILRGSDRAPRQISIPTVRDRLALRAVCQVLHEYVPATRGSAPHALVKQVVQAVRSEDPAGKSFVRLDVRDFFPSISHQVLTRELIHFDIEDIVQKLCLSAIQTPSGSQVNQNIRGVPQGLSISNALSAIYMLRFDELRIKKYLHYFRYVDDILLIVPTLQADQALTDISRALKSRGLIAHKKGAAGKTEISPLAEGIDFLGYRITIDKISIRDSSYKKMFKNLLKVITDFRYRKDVERLQFRLNLKITGCTVDAKRRGWMMFFSYTEDKSQLAFLDNFVNRHLIRCGFPKDKIGTIKRFIKSYHEIKFNVHNSDYIPNFDTFSDRDKADVIASLSFHKIEEILTWNIQKIEDEFSRLVSREVHDLEKDIGGFS